MKCNRSDSAEQHLCRWLLLSLDRLSSNELVLTEELIANMLGVRREGVTEAAGLIHYSRSHIVTVDRPKLDPKVCKCYSVVKGEYSRQLPEFPLK